MKRFFICLFLLSAIANLFAVDEIYLMGKVKEAVTKRDLTDAVIFLYDKDGNVKDSVSANMGRTWRDNQVDTTSNFYIKVPAVDSTYVFDVVSKEHETQTISYKLDKIKKRERSREIPIIYLNKVHELRELTVNATKIKFYNKGDTLVYDASAFQLPEGSMLDALIAQLPGVELSTDGQIKVNGRYVESLLLDGKKFFDNNNNLMLENIAAYTVKNVQVYEGVSRRDKEEGKDFNKVLTMDVKLKKEYSIGWLLNAQGSYGTSNRYMGRLFAAWFNPLWRVTAIGNVNNLNDNRKPGRNDTWTPDQMPSGRQQTILGGISYNYDNPDTQSTSEGDISFSHKTSNFEKRTDRTNFLSGGDTFEKSFVFSKYKSTSISLNNWSNFKIGNFGIGGSIYGSYNESRNEDSGISGAFTEIQDTLTYSTLEAIYSGGNESLLGTIINRSKTRTDGWTKSLSGYLSPSVIYLKSPDRFSFNFNVGYTSTKDEIWKDYEINYGPTYINPQKLRQYYDNTPNYNLNIGFSLGYSTNLSKRISLYVFYSYSFIDNIKDSYMYALDRLNDMGMFGTLPSGYLSSFDPDNSYKSRLITNAHSLQPVISYFKDFDKKSSLSIQIDPRIRLMHRHLNYWRNNKDYSLSKTNLSLNFQNWWSCRFYYSFRRRGEEPISKYTNTLMYSFIMNSEPADLFDMVDIVNDSDPLNIYLGNPDLKQQIYQRHHFRWNWMPQSYSLDNTFYFNYSYTLNALTRGYSYDSDKGIRYNKMYNVNGNRAIMFTNELKWQFGKTKQFTLDSYSEIEFSRNSDMIGENMQEPSLQKIRNRRISEKMKVSWQIGKINLALGCDLNNRYTTSTLKEFSTLNAWDIISGFIGQFQLPAGFSINTDFKCFTRNGYGTKYLDTTEPVWNLRLSYCPPKNTKWLFMIDGYDILHSLSNVSYAVNAAGRTVSYTNVLPRYLLFSVQYRLNLQPKR